MNGFDSSILAWLNQFAHQSPSFDGLVRLIMASWLFKAELLLAALLWFWFETGSRQRRNREIVLAALAAAFAAIIIGRGLAHFLPFRERPVNTPGFVVPFGADSAPLRNWSSFPSDHAMVLSALATGLFFLSRPIGAAAHLFWIVFVALPRLYLGLHYPTDILAGALVGSGLAALASTERVRTALGRAPLAWLERHPSSFQAVFFLLLVQVATMCDDLRELFVGIARAF